MGKAKNRYNIMNGIELTRRRNQNGSRIYLSTAIGSDVVCGLWMGLCTWAASGMLVGWTEFVGCTAYFASGGNWQMLLLCLMLGNFVGLGSDYLGRWVFGRSFKGRSDKIDWTILKFLDVKSKEE